MFTASYAVYLCCSGLEVLHVDVSSTATPRFAASHATYHCRNILHVDASITTTSTASHTIHQYTVILIFSMSTLRGRHQHVCRLTRDLSMSQCFWLFTSTYYRLRQHVYGNLFAASSAIHQCRYDLQPIYIDSSSTAVTRLLRHPRFINVAIILMFFTSTYHRRRQHVYRFTRDSSMTR